MKKLSIEMKGQLKIQFCCLRKLCIAENPIKNTLSILLREREREKNCFSFSKIRKKFQKRTWEKTLTNPQNFLYSTYKKYLVF